MSKKELNELNRCKWRHKERKKLQEKHANCHKYDVCTMATSKQGEKNQATQGNKKSEEGQDKWNWILCQIKVEECFISQKLLLRRGLRQCGHTTTGRAILKSTKHLYPHLTSKKNLEAENKKKVTKGTRISHGNCIDFGKKLKYVHFLMKMGPVDVLPYLLIT